MQKEVLPWGDDAGLKGCLRLVSDSECICYKFMRESIGKEAINAYEKNFGTIYSSKIGDCWDCWDRAIAMAKTLSDIGQIDKLRCELTKTLLVKPDVVDCTQLEISDMLLQFYNDEASIFAICEKLEKSADDLYARSEMNLAIQYYEVAAEWYMRAGVAGKYYEMLNVQVDILAQVGKVAEKENNKNFAAKCYEEAIERLNKIPDSFIRIVRADVRIKKLEALLNKTGMSEFCKINDKILSPENIYNDWVKLIVEYVQGIGDAPTLEVLEKYKPEAKKHVQNGNKFDSLGALANILPIIDFQNLIGEHLPVGKKVIDFYRPFTQATVRALILPAVFGVENRYRLKESDFLKIARESYIVPYGNANFVAKGLFAGYKRDFVTMMHILAPQTEAMIKTHLRRRGVDMIKASNGLPKGFGELLKDKKAKTIFGKELIFYIKSSFVGVGANLRNEVAHGEVESFFTTDAVYAWWLVLKLVINTSIKWEA